MTKPSAADLIVSTRIVKVPKCMREGTRQQWQILFRSLVVHLLYWVNAQNVQHIERNLVKAILKTLGMAVEFLGSLETFRLLVCTGRIQ